MLLCVLVFTVLVTLSSTLGSAHDFYSLSAVNMQGEHVPLEQYRGKVCIWNLQNMNSLFFCLNFVGNSCGKSRK